jgi:hypothetical protein
MPPDEGIGYRLVSSPRIRRCEKEVKGEGNGAPRLERL